MEKEISKTYRKQFLEDFKDEYKKQIGIYKHNTSFSMNEKKNKKIEVKLNVNNNISERRSNRFNKITNCEISNVASNYKNFPIVFSYPVDLEILVNFYERFWSGELSDDNESNTSSLDKKWFRNY